MTTPKEDQEHLRLLANFHYVVAGFAALFALFPVIHLAIGIAVVTGRFGDGMKGEPQWMGWFFIVFAGLWILCGLAFSVCLFLAGRFLRNRRRYLFCLVMAGIQCMFFPFGTILGVFSVVVLIRPSVKDLFVGQPVSASAVASP